MVCVTSMAGAQAVDRRSSCARSRKLARAAAEGGWRLVAAGGFPSGAIVGMFGVMMRPVFVWSVTSVHAYTQP